LKPRSLVALWRPPRWSARRRIGRAGAHGIRREPQRGRHAGPRAHVARPRPAALVGLHFKLAPEWHTYWKNGGDAGLPARIRWRLPDGFTAGEIQWPSARAPSDRAADELRLRPRGAAARRAEDAGFDRRGPVTLGARVDWLECKDACLPGKAELDIALPVTSGAPKPVLDWAGAFQKARARLPKNAA
jgi:thiol:disulfide interchange protein DsbD